MSVGVAAYPEHGTSVAQLIAAADSAMYRAKTLGRDRVVVAAGGEGRPSRCSPGSCAILVGGADCPGYLDLWVADVGWAAAIELKRTTPGRGSSTSPHPCDLVAS